MQTKKFDATMYVTVFELARAGMSNKQIAGTLGTSGNTFAAWCKRYPALGDALERGRAPLDGDEGMSFRQYVYDHLSPELRELWEDINECEDVYNGVERIEALLKNHGKRARQHLFVYALTQSVFNVSQSLRKLNIPRKTFESWCANDPEFAELMDEIHWHKNNFFEQAFMGRVAAGDTYAIIHAVKTKCRDRGYSEKIEVEHIGTVNLQMVSIADLDLDIETRRKVLDALRAKNAASAPVPVPAC